MTLSQDVVAAPPAPISDEEHRERRRRALDAARARGCDGLLVWSRGGTSADFYGDVLYLCGHHSPFPPNQDTSRWSGRSYSALVLAPDGSATLVTDLPGATASVDDVRFALDLLAATTGALRDAGLEGRRVGLAGRDSLTHHHHGRLVAGLAAGTELVALDDVVEELRAVKSPAELAWLRHASRAGAAWMSAMMGAVHDGATEGAVVGEGLRRFAELGGIAYDAAIASGDRSASFQSRAAIPSWEAARPVHDGEIVHVDAWGPVDGYYTDLMRSTVVGRRADDATREVLEAPVALVEHVLAGLRPGVLVGELYDRGAGWLQDNGFGAHEAATAEAGSEFGELFPAFGHGVGLGLEHPFILAGSTSVVREGMVFGVEAMVGRPGVGAAGFEQTVAVGADGAEVLTDGCPPRWWE